MTMRTMELKMITPHSRYDTFHTPYIQVWIIDFFHMACTNMGGGYAPTCMLAKLQELDDMISTHWMSCPDNWCTAKGNKSINAWYILELKGQGLNCRTICLPLKQWDFWSPLNRNSLIGDRFLLDEDLTNKFNTLLSQHYSSLLPPDVPTIFS